MGSEGEKENNIDDHHHHQEGETKISTAPAPHFALVHGISGGGWCWYKIKCLMEKNGFKVTCIDLKGAGIDTSDANSLFHFHDYNQPLVDFISALPPNQQVILVGHSAGGLSVTHASHLFPDKIKLAIYLGATMLKNGFWTEEDVKNGVPDLTDFGDDVYDLEFGEGHDHPPTSVIVKKEYQRDIIYHMCPPEDSTLAGLLLRPGPIRALQSARFTDGPNVNRVARVYIRTSDDRVVKPHQQDAMIKKWPPSEVYCIESDHSPFFSAPLLLFDLLVKAASSRHCK